MQHVNPWNKPEEKREVNNQTSSNEAESTSHFLVRYLENMKADLEKSLEQKLERALQSRVPTREYQAEPIMQHQINPLQTMQTHVATQVSNQKPQLIQPVNHGPRATSESQSISSSASTTTKPVQSPYDPRVLDCDMNQLVKVIILNVQCQFLIFLGYSFFRRFFILNKPPHNTHPCLPAPSAVVLLLFK